MNNNKYSWRNWLIKKLISNQSNKDELLRILGDNSDLINDGDEDVELENNNENRLIKNILDLNEKNVEDIMVPRANIIAIDKNQTIKNILSIIETESHSRMPVYDGNLDNILGFVHIKDVIKNLNIDKFNIQSILRDILYVAPKSPILDLLQRMRSSRKHIALVVDEFGGVDGLVTIEDLVEEIVGEIEDEHDINENIKFQKVDDTTIIVDASYTLEDLEKFYNIKIGEISSEEIDTVGGLVFFLAGKVPKKEESFKYKNFLKFKILSATNRRINTLEIKKQ